MKRIPSLLLLASLAAGSLFAAGNKQEKADKYPNVVVNFHEPEKFTDARSHFSMQTDEGNLEILADHVKKTASKQLTAGQKLEVTFTDIDLAGDFLPAQMRGEDIRIVKEIYFPRATLTFKLTDANGKVIKEGERRLSDMNFMMNISPLSRSESLYYDKTLLSDWIRKELKP